MNGIIHIIDTSIYCNILRIPQKSQDHDVVIEEFRECFSRRDIFFLPIATIFETGNLIARSANTDRYSLSIKFKSDVINSLKNGIPYSVLTPFDDESLLESVERFPEFSKAGIGIGDVSIIDQYFNTEKSYPDYNVRIWSLDEHLSGYSNY